MRINFAKHLLLALAPLLSLASHTKPNIILLLSDDQAWNGLSVKMDPDVPQSKSDFIETPNIAKLAAEGMRFTDAYAPAPVCSSTRISIQTGRTPAQMHLTRTSPTLRASEGYQLVGPQNKKSISTEAVTIAERLKQAGYVSAHFGKWHLNGDGPEANGYSISDGNLGNEYARNYKDPNPVDIFGMCERATKFMEAQKAANRPFYIQMSFHALHSPDNALQSTIEKYKGKAKSHSARVKDRTISRAAIAEDLDTGVGRLMEALERLNLNENTYVIYMSDNGSSGGRRESALRGGKGDLYEGGIRVPIIVRGPSIQAGSLSRVPIVGYDFLTTFSKLAGIQTALPQGVEGGDFSHLFTGSNVAVKRPEEGLYFHFPHYQGTTPHSAIRYENYKLIKFYESGECVLYDLSQDLGEKKDLSSAMPEKVQELLALLEAQLESVEALMPRINPSHTVGKKYVRTKGAPKADGKRK